MFFKNDRADPHRHPGALASCSRRRGLLPGQRHRGDTRRHLRSDLLRHAGAAGCQGHGFSFAVDSWPYARANQPTAFWSYLYTLYLAAVYALFGHHPLVARLIQAVAVGLLMPWLIYRIGRRAFGVRVGLIAAGLTAVYFYFVHYAASLMSEAFYIVGILWTVDVGMRLADSLVADPPVRFRPRRPAGPGAGRRHGDHAAPAPGGDWLLRRAGAVAALAGRPQ